MPAFRNETTAWGLNQLCGSGLRAIALGMQQIAAGDASIIVAGGQEFDVHGPACAASARRHQDGRPEDGRHDDQGRPDRRLLRLSHGHHRRERRAPVAVDARGCRTSSRVASQNKAEAAQKAGRFKDEIVPVTVKGRKGDTVVDQDEYIRHGATLDAMQKLRPAFDKEGTVTAGNASGHQRRRRRRRPDERSGSVAARASRRWRASFPGQRPASIRRSWAPARSRLRARPWRRPAGRCPISTSWRPTRPSPRRPARSTRIWAGIRTIVNVNGGAIAIGHPVGASGARVFNTLLYEMRRRGARKGLATLCIGGGMGVAMCVEIDEVRDRLARKAESGRS